MKDSNKIEKFENTFTVKVEPATVINLEHEKMKDWDFLWNVERMLSSKEMDMISDKSRINRLPDMFFGNNRFYIINVKNNFIYEINPLKMLDLGNFSYREEKLVKDESLSKPQDLNFIYYIPKDVKVQFYDKWRNIKVDRDDVKKIDPVEDWTFSSSYMGSLEHLDKHPVFHSNINLFESFDSFKKYKPLEIQKTEENLPIDRLGQDNPIIKYMEINLYDDELCDNGLSMGNFR